MSKASFPQRNPIVDPPTHTVTNQPPPMADYNLFDTDRARRIVEDMGVLLQASLLLRNAPDAVSSAFIVSRLPGQMRGCYGALPSGLALEAIVARARLAS